MDRRNPVITVSVQVSPSVPGKASKLEFTFEALDEGNADAIRSQAARRVDEFIKEIAEAWTRSQGKAR